MPGKNFVLFFCSKMVGVDCGLCGMAGRNAHTEKRNTLIDKGTGQRGNVKSISAGADADSTGKARTGLELEWGG